MLVIFASIGFFFLLLERLFPVHKQPLFRRGFWLDMFYVPIHYFMRVFVNGTLAVGLSELSSRFFPDFRLHWLARQPVWLQAVLLLVVLDFVFYIMHRFKHHWTWWWRLHETHHSSTDLDWASSIRFHPLEKLLDRAIYLLPIIFLSVSQEAMFIWASVDVFFGMFGHSNLNCRIGPLIYVFVGPEMHRWHHVRDSRIRECNYGNNLSIFDWIFGTAYISKDQPSDFGVRDDHYPQQNMLKQFGYAFRPARQKTNPLQ
jgi:sterol desaturase/sphingolipid hydroxylase (fatty acid hydroxylase superfamily)